MAVVISGKELALLKRENMAKEIPGLLEKYGRVPHLAVVLIGDDAGSVSYVRGKEKGCNEVGIKNTTIVKGTDITESELLGLIDELNSDDTVDGILVQLPLPGHINSDKIINAIDPRKDVDGFHPHNVARLYLNEECILPCTPKGVMALLDYAGIEVKGKNACVIGRSNIVGMPVAKLLLNRDATVTICHSKTENLSEITSKADILIAAVGKPLFVKEDMVKKGAIVIDVGVNRNPETGKLCGDVDFINVKEKASFITKVPGGVGPMTITCLLENTIECFIKRMSSK